MRRAAAVLLCCALPACTVGVRRAAPTVSPSRSATVPATAPACSTTYAAPDPKRPVIRLAFEVDDTHSRVTGTEHVVFTPDRPVNELVFRLWMNGPGPAEEGGSIEVSRASFPMTLSENGTLLSLALPAPSPAGRAVMVDLAFAITLPRASVDRWGHTGRTAWWASAHPLLAWVRGGAGWAREPAAGLLGETATSEAASYDVTVTAPAADYVAGISLPEGPVDAGGGRARWRFRNALARDVSVAAGPFATRQVTIGEVPVLVAVSDELATGTSAEAVFGPVVDSATESLAFYTRRFGPFPFPSLTFAAIGPIGTSGVEYPGMIFLGSRRYEVVVPHEIGHEWFYALVGDDQARDPWLDEAFATYAESLVNDSGDRYLRALDADGRVGEPMAYWDRHEKDYGTVVYAKGAAALLAARDTVGEAAFDAVLRCYLAANAFRVATPADVERAFAPLPEAVRILREAGALPR